MDFLVIDSEEKIVETINAQLKREDVSEEVAKAVRCASLEEAVKIIGVQSKGTKIFINHEFTPNGGEGLEVVRRFSNQKNPRFLFFSTSAYCQPGSQLRKDYKEAGVVDFVEKSKIVEKIIESLLSWNHSISAPRPHAHPS